MIFQVHALRWNDADDLIAQPHLGDLHLVANLPTHARQQAMADDRGTLILAKRLPDIGSHLDITDFAVPLRVHTTHKNMNHLRFDNGEVRQHRCDCLDAVNGLNLMLIRHGKSTREHVRSARLSHLEQPICAHFPNWEGNPLDDSSEGGKHENGDGYSKNGENRTPPVTPDVLPHERQNPQDHVRSSFADCLRGLSSRRRPLWKYMMRSACPALSPSCVTMTTVLPCSLDRALRISTT